MKPDFGSFIAIVLRLMVGAIFILCIYIVNTLNDGPKDTRFVLCKEIIANTENPARDDPDVLALCANVGVTK